MPWRLIGGRPARFCSPKCVGTHQAAVWALQRPPCSENGCSKPSRRRGLCKTHYNRATGHGWESYCLTKDPSRERARLRAKTYLRKATVRLTDITPEFDEALRAKAKHCPLCAAKLIDAPYLPNSKELDHIVPLNVGGTHTIGNVRIICRRCNQARPWDGSDYSGPVTLWAQVG